MFMYNQSIERIGIKLTVVLVSVGDSHVIVIANDDSNRRLLLSCGSNNHGELGLGYSNDYEHELRRIIIHDEIPIDASAGVNHSAIVTTNGNVYTFGSGHLFVLGHGDQDDHYEPCLVESLQDHHITKVSCGLMHTAVLDSSNKVYHWGVSVDTKQNKKVSLLLLLLPLLLLLLQLILILIIILILLLIQIIGLPISIDIPKEDNDDITMITSGSRHIALLTRNTSCDKVIVIGQIGVIHNDDDDDDDDGTASVNLNARKLYETTPANIVSIVSSYYELGILLKS